ncbi:MAG: hypothetical protein LKG19_10990 [Saprospiraceae bacterium]|nr:hypothetical protein [Saprospiraceae bacterium]
MRLVQLIEMEACPARRNGGFRWVLLTRLLRKKSSHFKPVQLEKMGEHLGYFFLFDLCIKSPPFPREDLGGFYFLQLQLLNPPFP